MPTPITQYTSLLCFACFIPYFTLDYCLHDEPSRTWRSGATRHITSANVAVLNHDFLYHHNINFVT